MMTFIKIIFILLLMIPIAVLMRFLLDKLAAEVPAQMDSAGPENMVDKKKRKHSGNKSNSGRKSGSGKGKKSGSSSGKNSGPEGKSSGKGDGDEYSNTGSKSGPTRQARPAAAKKGSDDGYTPRQPEEWHRSERVPFGESEGYRVEPPGKRSSTSSQAKQWKKPSDAVRERREEKAADDSYRRDVIAEPVSLSEERPASRKKNRSEKMPSKRQLRKNRERARKRDMKKRREERKKEGQDKA